MKELGCTRKFATETQVVLLPAHFGTLLGLIDTFEWEKEMPLAFSGPKTPAKVGAHCHCTHSLHPLTASAVYPLYPLLHPSYPLCIHRIRCCIHRRAHRRAHRRNHRRAHRRAHCIPLR